MALFGSLGRRRDLSLDDLQAAIPRDAGAILEANNYARANAAPMMGGFSPRASDTPPDASPAWAPKKPGILDFIFTGPVGYREKGDQYRQYQRLQALKQRLPQDQQWVADVAPDKAMDLLFPTAGAAAVNVPEGSALVDPRTGKVVYQGAPKPRAPMRIDRGDRIELIDPLTNETVGSFSKNAAPGSGGFGKAPSGFRYTAGGDLEPIPGGPAARKIAEQKRKADGMMRSVQATAKDVLAAVAKAKTLAQDDRNTGLIGQTFSGWGGTGQHDLAAAIETIVANIGFDKLQEMRANSPTGGALGAVTERELSLLQSVVANLKQSQSKQQFLDNLSRVEMQYNRTLQSLDDAYAEDFGGAPPAEDKPDPLGLR